jgi:two-component system chemotaxis response regulator CheY
LIVDDSTAAREQVREALSSTMTVRFSEAAGGQEALWRARCAGHDLIITDLHMPTMDGLELLRQLRKLPGYASVPVLVLTADPNRERLKEGRQAGATGWLVKPPKPDALVMAVRHALFNRR